MSKTKKILYASFFLAAICGVILGMIRGEIMFESPYPAFYIAIGIVFVFLIPAAHFTSVNSKIEGREDINIADLPTNWDELYTKRIKLFQLISVFVILIAAVRSITLSMGSTIGLVSAVFAFACSASIFFRVKEKDLADNTAVLSLFPVFYLCFYLLMFYRSTAKFPDLNLFGPQIITLSALIVTAYFNAATKFGSRPAILRYLISFFSLSLTLGDLVAYLFTANAISITEASGYLLNICGFTLYFTISLLVPPVRFFKTNAKNISKDNKKA